MAHASSTPGEIELKLALPGAEQRHIVQQLASALPLAGTDFKQQRLRNIYFDTPEQHLRKHKAALRLRSVREGAGSRPRWIQTLKTAGHSAGGLSQRGEWETTLRRGALDPAALQDTPWHAIDGDEHLFAQLAPCFETESTRTLWQINTEDGSRIEIALDLGTVRANGLRLPICELELELVQGRTEAIFTLAKQIAAHTAVRPAETSKAEHGWRLASGISAVPVRARVLPLEPHQPALEAAQEILGEMLSQFTGNLTGILHADHAELVHQARVGWRRWRSGLWLFKPLLQHYPAPDMSALEPLLKALGALRDLDVAALESLPPWADAFIAGDARREADWRAMEAALQVQRRAGRTTLLKALAAPATGAALVRASEWLHGLHAQATPERLGPWAAKRVQRLHQRLSREVDAMEATEDSQDNEAVKHQHRARLLAKRTRYCLEAMQAVVPTARARRWTNQATELQTGIGAARDLQLLADLLQPLGVDRAIIGFLRGIAAHAWSSRKSVR